MDKGDIETNYPIRTFPSSLSLEEFANQPRREIYVILDNLRSAFNVGGIFRTADSGRIKLVMPCGYTAFPPHSKLEKTSLGAVDYVPWKHFATTREAVGWIRQKEIPIICVEKTEKSSPLREMKFEMPVCLVMGNEALGVSQEILDRANRIVSVPMDGFKNSLNVGVTFGIVLYEIIRQTG